MKALTERLQRLRFERKRMSQRDAAKNAGMPHSRYWEIENGYRKPDQDDVRKLARAFHCTEADILGEKPEPAESVAS